MKQATLHQLKVFEVVARHSSFTRAAEELFLTQPTVSMQVKQLAKAVGLPLFEQIGKRLYLTDAGRELLATCQDIFEKLSQFESAVADLKGLKQGYLRLAAITTTKYVIPRLLDQVGLPETSSFNHTLQNNQAVIGRTYAIPSKDSAF